MKDSEIFDKVTELLPSFGYKYTTKDSALLRLCISTIIERLKAYTNQREIPDGLYFELYKMVIGEFFYNKKQFGGLEDGGISFPSKISQYTEGDTSISFSKVDKAENDFDAAVNEMRFGNPSVIEHYRRLHWHL